VPAISKKSDAPKVITGGKYTNTEGLTLADSDFETSDTVKWQCNALIYGKAGEGKTSFATMFAPQPVALINFDNRDTHAVRRAREDGRVVHRVHIPYASKDVTNLDEAEAKKIGGAAMDKVVKNFEIAVRESQRGNIRTICIDTGTEYSEIVTLAVRGGLGKANDYGKSKDLINRAWWHIFNTAREGNAHLLVLARDKEIWAGGEPTGRYTLRGPEVMIDGVDWAGWMRLKKAGGGLGGKTVKKIKKFELEIVKAGVNIEQLGEVYAEEQWGDLGGPFVYASLLQYEGSDVEDWM
jgi:hypothetical protein